MAALSRYSDLSPTVLVLRVNRIASLVLWFAPYPYPIALS